MLYAAFPEVSLSSMHFRVFKRIDLVLWPATVLAHLLSSTLFQAKASRRFFLAKASDKPIVCSQFSAKQQS